jgi:hypothetical protein
MDAVASSDVRPEPCVPRRHPAGRWFILALVITAGTADAQETAARVAVADAIRSMNCRVELMNPAQNQTFQDLVGLETSAYGAAIDSLVGDRLASLDPVRGIVSLSRGLCGMDRIDRVVVDGARLYHCAMTPEQASAHWPKVGLDANQAGGTLSYLAPDGTLPPDLCALKPAHADLRTAWIAAFAENGCRLDLDHMADLSLRHGIKPGGDAVIDAWMADGIVTRDEPSALYLDPSVCVPGALGAISPEARTLAMLLATAGCAMEDRQLAAIAADRGLTRGVAGDALLELILSGHAQADGTRASLTETACQAMLPPGLSDEARDRLDMVVGMTTRRVLQQNTCRLEMADLVEQVMAEARVPLRAGPARTPATDRLMTRRIEAVVASDGYEREGDVVVLKECKP